MDRTGSLGCSTVRARRSWRADPAVVAGASFWISPTAQPAAPLAGIYGVREAHTRRIGLETLGFAAAVEALRARGQDLVRLGAVDLDEPLYHFQVFLDEPLTAVVACLGVDQGWRHRPSGGGSAVAG